MDPELVASLKKRRAEMEEARKVLARTKKPDLYPASYDWAGGKPLGVLGEIPDNITNDWLKALKRFVITVKVGYFNATVKDQEVINNVAERLSEITRKRLKIKNRK